MKEDNIVQWMGLAVLLMLNRDQIERMVQTRQSLTMVLNDYQDKLLHRNFVVVVSHDVAFQTQN